MLKDPTIQQVANAHNRSTAQVCLKWVRQLGHPLATSATKVDYMLEDLDIFDWTLSDAEMDALTKLEMR